ncbi:MAG: Ig-like domain-containing protein [Clostridium sp.]
MAISQARAQINGTWYNLTYNSSTGKYETTITAPNVSSYNVNAGHYYPVIIEATNTAGTITTKNDTDATIGNSLKLTVKERVKPTIAITSPGSGAYVTNNKQPIVFQLRDEVNGSGLNIGSLVLKIDSGTAIGNASAGMVCNQVVNGYDCTYTPQTALGDGSHNITIDISDFDGNTATQVTRSFTIDTVPPVLNISSPSNSFITNIASLVVQGTTNDATSSPTTITIKLNNVDQGAVTITSGSFSKSITLATGANTIIVTASDAAGKTTATTITGNLDTSAPNISAVTITPNPIDAGATMIISVMVTG